MSKLDGELVIVVSSPGNYDTIYVGVVEREGDMIVLRKASMIVRYEDVGVSGLAGQPEKAVSLRPVTSGNGEVWIPLSGVAAIVVADADKWAGHLGVSRG